MIRFFADHPTAGNLLMILFLALGIVTLPEIKRETFPEVKAYSVEVKVPYPGATPSDVELGICLVLEEAFDGISFIEEKNCEARQSLGLMTLKMLEQGDFNKFLNDVKSAVDAINDFPGEAEIATVEEKGRTQNVIAVALTADIPRSELKTLAEQLKQKLLQDPAIPLVKIHGFSERQLRVEVSNSSLRSLGLSLQELANLIAKQDVDMPVGAIETLYRETQLRVNDERRTAAELSQLILFTGENGSEVRLIDIATVTDTFENPEDKVSYQQKPTALLKISKYD